jgi:hypothetical protein
MSSLQKPRKIKITSSTGEDYLFLCKPKDDLRKDCRLMEFNSMINILLKKDSEARKRDLCRLMFLPLTTDFNRLVRYPNLLCYAFERGMWYY